MAKWFKKRVVPIEEFTFSKKPDPQVMVLEGEFATATRAIVQGFREMPRMQFKFRVRHGFDEKSNEEFDEVWIEMDLYKAGEFIQQAINSHAAALPGSPRPARQTQYGE
jgi:hypothetical protein